MKGIIFSEGNFRAIVAGNKTQTRRTMKPQPLDDLIKTSNGWRYTIGFSHKRALVYYRPRYKVGEMVYLKEPYLCTGALEGHKAEFDYLYGKNEEPRIQILNRPDLKGARTMPARAARYFIKITDVRAERVQDISEEDCIAEGIVGRVTGVPPYDYVYQIPGCPQYYYTAKQAYAAEIDQIYGKGSWDENPWVWVYEFQLKL